ncbi:jmjC domain-containing protein 4-like [Sinocyclocheilus anshuiensis]|uniref:jmjC domain-containing protein 4-like n=1 Tax=Sinocyclocheilus anshuiensis TaxID=1608454 RepID=UPI0007B8972D|nr:PREDICTED: jmjC domain-containing protein 4-like [Sinocyclocheilus anshuiensis]
MENLTSKDFCMNLAVANCSAKEYNSNPKQIMPFKEFMQYWREYIQNGHSAPKGCLYVKDWHMQRNFPKHNTYKTPIYFFSDWLNEYWDTIEVDDYRFVYMGPTGSWTPFHADMFRSYSWSANICGHKKWLLYPPGQEEFLRDCHGNLAYDVTAPVLQDKGLYPQFEEACQPLEIIQEAGEIIFGCPILLLEDQCPAEFCSNLPKQTCLEVFYRQPLF